MFQRTAIIPGVTDKEYIYEKNQNLTALTLTQLLVEKKDLVILKLFNVYNNRIERIPFQVFTMVALTQLNLGRNAITILPEAIGQLTNLVSINLNVNRLQTLPMAIGKCVRLELLYVSVNPLCRLPPTMIYLVELTTFQTTLMSNIFHINPIETFGFICARGGNKYELQKIADRFSYRGARAATITLLALSRPNRRRGVGIAKDVLVYLLAPMLYATRNESVWHELDDAEWEIQK